MSDYEVEAGQSEFAEASDASSFAEWDGVSIFGGSDDDDPDEYLDGVEIDGEYFPNPPGPIGDLRPGESVEERNARLRRGHADVREYDRRHGTVGGAVKLGDAVFEVDERRGVGYRVGRPTERIPVSAVKVTDAQGNAAWQNIGRDADALELFLEAQATERGFTLDDLRRRFPAGRPRPRERFRRKVLGEAIAAARAAGAKTGAIEQVLGLDRRRISELVDSE